MSTQSVVWYSPDQLGRVHMGIGYNRARKLLECFHSKHIVVIGDIMLDQYVFGSARRMSPEAPVPVLRQERLSASLGGAGNVAKNVVTLGAKATLTGVIGKDDPGLRLLEIVRSEGINYELHMAAERPTTIKTRFLAGGHHMLRVDAEDSSDLKEADEAALIQHALESIVGADGVVVSDYDKGVIGESLSRSILTQARAQNIPVLVDAKPRRMRFLRGADAVSPNFEEACAYLAGYASSWEITDVAAAIREHYQIGTTFITAGDQGMYVLDSTGGVMMPQDHRVEVADTSGCGDTAAAVLLLCMLCDATPTEAALLANAAGAVVATKIGAVAPRPEEILQMLC